MSQGLVLEIDATPARAAIKLAQANGWSYVLRTPLVFICFCFYVLCAVCYLLGTTLGTHSHARCVLISRAGP
jgi:hypothetical protein